MKIAVGTKSVPKLMYLHEVLDDLGIMAEMLAFDVESGITEQPMTSKETKEGSINRARNAFALLMNADLAIGIEVGYHPNKKGDYEIFCYATLVDKNGIQFTSESHRLLLPDFHQGVLKENKYLGDYVRKYIEDNTDKQSKELGEDIRDRKSFIKAAIKLVFSDYLKRFADMKSEDIF